MIGSGIGGLPGITEGAITLHERGPRRISPFFIPSSLINLASGHVSIRYGFKGPNHAVVTACSTGAHAIGDAARLIMLDDADVMVCGGAEAAICRLGLAGFAAARALSTGFNDDPPRASRPWDKDRDGFVMGEGAGIVVLEELRARQEARRQDLCRGHRLRHVGRRLSHHRAGRGRQRRLPRDAQRAEARAASAPDKIDYINAHGTSTPLGDEIELGAVKRLFGDHAYKLSMSSTKSAIGHLLGAAGSVEAIFSILAMRDGVVPPTLNLDNPSPACDIDLVPQDGQGAQGPLRAVQLVRLRRHQRLADLRPARPARMRRGAAGGRSDAGVSSPAASACSSPRADRRGRRRWLLALSRRRRAGPAGRAAHRRHPARDRHLARSPRCSASERRHPPSAGSSSSPARADRPRRARSRPANTSFAAGDRARASAIDIIASGKTVKHRLTIPEGLTSAEIVALVRDAPALDGRSGPAAAEGELLPDTYFYSYGDTPRGTDRRACSARWRRRSPRPGRSAAPTCRWPARRRR